MRLDEKLLVDPICRPTVFDGGWVVGFREITRHVVSSAAWKLLEYSIVG
jgi:hypothetical protein